MTNTIFKVNDRVKILKQNIFGRILECDNVNAKIQIDYDINNLSYASNYEQKPRTILYQTNKQIISVAIDNLKLIESNCEWNLGEIVVVSEGKYFTHKNYAVIDKFLPKWTYKENKNSVTVKVVDFKLSIRLILINEQNQWEWLSTITSFSPTQNNVIDSWENGVVLKLDDNPIYKETLSNLNKKAIKDLNNSNLTTLLDVIK